MYRNQDSDHGQTPTRAVPVPEAQPINQTEFTELQRAEAEIPASPIPAAAPRDPAAPTAGASGAAVSPAGPQRSRRKLVLAAIVLAAAGTGGWFGYHYLTVGRFLVTTDDAYVQAYNTTLAAKVAGYIASVPVIDNTYVHAGDVIATIDDGDFQLAVDSAREKVATQEATVAHGAPDRRPGSRGRAGEDAARLQPGRGAADGA
jgi:membrane fusion protein (multidrug efflux system)